MKKIVFCDLDGTLLNSKKEVLPENFEAIKKARENGIEVCVCTGRQQEAAKVYQEMAGASKYIICTNGAEIYDTEAKDELFSSPLDEDICIQIYEYAIKNNLFVRVDTKYGRYINIKEYQMSTEVIMEEDYKKFFKENKVLQLCVGGPDVEIIDDMEKAINESKTMKIVNRFISSLIPVRIPIIDIVNSSVSKGNAILGLCRYLKIDPKDAVGFGDDINDIPMLEAVGYGVAMGNSTDDVKAVANEITTNNDEPGIAQILNRIIEENKQ